MAARAKGTLKIGNMNLEVIKPDNKLRQNYGNISFLMSPLPETRTPAKHKVLKSPKPKKAPLLKSLKLRSNNSRMQVEVENLEQLCLQPTSPCFAERNPSGINSRDNTAKAPPARLRGVRYPSQQRGPNSALKILLPALKPARVKSPDILPEVSPPRAQAVVADLSYVLKVAQ